jgi:hypothetical protein
MTTGNIKGLDAGAGSQDSTNHFALMPQGLPVASFLWQLVMFTNKQGFGNADCRDVCKYSQMAGKTKPARMSDALTITQY